MKTPRPLPIVSVVLVLLVALVAAPAAAQSQMTWAVHISLAPTWFDPGEHTGIITIMKVLYARARRHGEAHAGQRHGAVAGRVVDACQGRPQLRVRPPQGRRLPQRRSPHRGGREVLLRALPGRGGQAAQGQGGRGGDRRFPPRALPAEGAVARLHDLLRHARPPARAGSCPRSTSRRWATTASRRRPIGAGPYKLASLQPGRRAGAGGARPLLAQDPRREAPGVAGRPRGPHAAGHAQARRGRRRLLAARPPRRGSRSAPRALRLVPTVISATQWLDFGPLQWDPKSPWHDRRVRLAAALAFDKNAINQAETLGHSRSRRAASSPRRSSTRCPSRPIRTTRRRRRSSWPRRAIPTGSTRGDYAGDVVVLQRGGGHRQLPRARWASARRCVPWSAWPSSASGRTRRSASIMHAGAGGHGNAATRVQNYFARRGCTRGGAIPTWTTSTSSRPASSTRSAARRSCTRSSGWPTSVSCTRRSGSWAS